MEAALCLPPTASVATFHMCRSLAPAPPGADVASVDLVRAVSPSTAAAMTAENQTHAAFVPRCAPSAPPMFDTHLLHQGPCVELRLLQRRVATLSLSLKAAEAKAASDVAAARAEASAGMEQLWAAIDVLQAENTQLKAQVAQMQAENKQLKAQVVQTQAEDTQLQKREAERTSILRCKLCVVQAIRNFFCKVAKGMSTLQGFSSEQEKWRALRTAYCHSVDHRPVIEELRAACLAHGLTTDHVDALMDIIENRNGEAHAMDKGKFAIIPLQELRQYCMDVAEEDFDGVAVYMKALDRALLRGEATQH